jgi:hypothetical protein
VNNAIYKSIMNTISIIMLGITMSFKNMTVRNILTFKYVYNMNSSILHNSLMATYKSKNEYTYTKTETNRNKETKAFEW